MESSLSNQREFTLQSSQLSLRYFYGMDLRHVADMLRRINTIYEINSSDTSKHYDLCHRYGDHCRIIVRLVPGYYFSCVLAFAFISVYEYSKSGVLRAPYSLYLPSFDGQQWLHVDAPLFVTNCAMEFIVMIIIITHDTIILLAIANVPLITTIIVENTNDLLSRTNIKQANSDEIRAKLLNFLFMHDKFIE